MEIKPCPFCGGDVELKISQAKTNGQSGVYLVSFICAKKCCGGYCFLIVADSEKDASDQAISKFNKRANGFLNLQNEVHQISVDHGWWENEPSFPETIALIHSELSEALEEYRSGHAVDETYNVDGKPEGIPTELADVVIRIMDYCAAKDINLEQAIIDKISYNKTRPYKHGGKVI